MRLRTEKTEFVITVGDAAVTVSPLSATEAAKLREKYTLPPKRGEVIPGFDANGMTRELFARVVRDWSGVGGLDGKVLECTAETKAGVYEHNADFARDVLAEMDVQGAALREVSVKN